MVNSDDRMVLFVVRGKKNSQKEDAFFKKQYINEDGELVDGYEQNLEAEMEKINNDPTSETRIVFIDEPNSLEEVYEKMWKELKPNSPTPILATIAHGGLDYENDHYMVISENDNIKSHQFIERTQNNFLNMPIALTSCFSQYALEKKPQNNVAVSDSKGTVNQINEFVPLVIRLAKYQGNFEATFLSQTLFISQKDRYVRNHNKSFFSMPFFGGKIEHNINPFNFVDKNNIIDGSHLINLFDEKKTHTEQLDIISLAIDNLDYYEQIPWELRETLSKHFEHLYQNPSEINDADKCLLGYAAYPLERHIKNMNYYLENDDVYDELSHKSLKEGCDIAEDIAKLKDDKITDMIGRSLMYRDINFLKDLLSYHPDLGVEYRDWRNSSIAFNGFAAADYGILTMLQNEGLDLSQKNRDGLTAVDLMLANAPGYEEFAIAANNLLMMGIEPRLVVKLSVKYTDILDIESLMGHIHKHELTNLKEFIVPTLEDLNVSDLLKDREYNTALYLIEKNSLEQLVDTEHIMRAVLEGKKEFASHLLGHNPNNHKVKQDLSAIYFQYPKTREMLNEIFCENNESIGDLLHECVQDYKRNKLQGKHYISDRLEQRLFEEHGIVTTNYFRSGNNKIDLDGDKEISLEEYDVLEKIKNLSILASEKSAVQDADAARLNYEMESKIEELICHSELELPYNIKIELSPDPQYNSIELSPKIGVQNLSRTLIDGPYK